MVIFTLKCLLHVYRFLCAGLEVRYPTFGLAEGLRAFRRDLPLSVFQQYKRCHVITHHSLALFHINLVAYHDLCPVSHVSQIYSQGDPIQMEKSLGPSGSLVSETRPSSYPVSQNSSNCSHRILERSNPRLCKTPRPNSGSVLVLPYPKSISI
jgi:hypothetical protein